MGETLPIEVKVANNDDRKISCALSVFLQPAEDGEDDGEYDRGYESPRKTANTSAHQDRILK